MDNTGTFSDTFADDSIDSFALADGAATYNYGANGNALISENRGGASKYYHSDGLGSTTALTNSSESTTDTRVTDAFGNPITGSGSTPTPFGFGGQSGYQADADTGLKLCGARYYDSSAGRFLSRDPAFSGTNWYTYCGNDPVNGMDSTGLGSPSTAPGWITQTSPLLPPPGWNGGNGGSGGPDWDSIGGSFAIGVAEGAAGALVGLGIVALAPVLAPALLVAGIVGAAITIDNMILDGQEGNWNGVAQGAGGIVGGAIVGGIAEGGVGGGGEGGDVTGGGSGGNGGSGSFFDGSWYSEKVLQQASAVKKDFHTFPELVDTYENYGQVIDVTGGDGIVRSTLQVPGTYQGYDGYFEWMKDPDGRINHRCFIARSKVQ